MRRLLPLLALALLAAGCSNRDRLNPLDPANVTTGGAPQGFAARAGDRTVQLDWTLPRGGLIAGFRLYRSIGGADYDSLVDLDPAVSRYYDSNLVNGVDYGYRIAYILTNGVIGRTSSDVATPGTVQPWVVDVSGAALYRLTPDGRHVSDTESGRFVAPTAVAVAAPTQVWVCDPDGGRLWRVLPGIAAEEVGSLVRPTALAVDRARGRVWVCDEGQNQLQSLDLTNPVAPYAVVPGLARPISVALDPTDGSAWVCERNGDRVRHVSTSGGALGSAIAIEPSRVAVDSLTRRIWVSSLNRRRVLAFTSNGALVDSIEGLTGPVGIAVDSRAGRIWVADTDGGRVIAYDRNGDEVARSTGVTNPLEIAVDVTSGQVWVVSSFAGQVVRLAPDGQVLSRTLGFVVPTGIAVWP